MSRPDFVSSEDITRWDLNINSDPKLPKEMLELPFIKEMFYASLFLAEHLTSLGCPDTLISKMQYNLGKKSFSQDPWEVAMSILDDFDNNRIEDCMVTSSMLN